MDQTGVLSIVLPLRENYVWVVEAIRWVLRGSRRSSGWFKGPSWVVKWAQPTGAQRVIIWASWWVAPRVVGDCIGRPRVAPRVMGDYMGELVGGDRVVGDCIERPRVATGGGGGGGPTHLPPLIAASLIKLHIYNRSIIQLSIITYISIINRHQSTGRQFRYRGDAKMTARSIFSHFLTFN